MCARCVRARHVAMSECRRDVCVCKQDSSLVMRKVCTCCVVETQSDGGRLLFTMVVTDLLRAPPTPSRTI